jgi:hypothetical protein
MYYVIAVNIFSNFMKKKLFFTIQFTTQRDTLGVNINKNDNERIFKKHQKNQDIIKAC